MTSQEDKPCQGDAFSQLSDKAERHDHLSISCSDTEALWARAVAERRQELVAARVPNIVHINNYQAVQAGVELFHSRRRRTRANKLLESLDSVIERLQKFVLAISVFIQCDPTYSSLIWGGLLACLECFSQSNRAMKAIEKHLGYMTRAMPRFEEYTQLYPTHDRLKIVMLNIYGHYLDACIFAIKFLRQKSWWRPIASILSSVVKNFQDACQSILDSAVEFEDEARFAHDKEADNHRRRSQSYWEKAERHQSLVESVLPSLTSHPTMKEALFSVPFPRNKQFVGRVEELGYLKDTLVNECQCQASCIIFGIGGVGKTNLALEVCFRFKEHFRFTFWVAAENEAALSTSFANLAAELNIYDGSQGPSSLTTDTMRRWLCDNTGWLLVFDNADSDQSALNKFWPPCDHGSILVTSQNSDWAERTPDVFKLEPLNEDLGSQLLLQLYHNRAKNDDLHMARSITKEVDGLPLLLVSLGGSLSQNHLDLKETLEALRNSPAPLKHILADKTPAWYERPTQLVFHLSFSQLKKPARQVISVMAMFSPNDIPEALIMARPGKEDLGDELASVWFARNVRQSLCSRNLVDIRSEVSERAYSMHRSVQRYVIAELSDDDRQNAFDEGVKLLCSRLPRPSSIMVPHLTGFELFARYIPHVLHIHNTFRMHRDRLIPSVPFAEMICSAAAYLYETGLAESCLDVATTGEEICEQLDKLSTEDVAGPSAPQIPTPLEISFDNIYEPVTYSLGTLAGNISAYGAGVIWSTGGLIDRQDGNEMTWKVLKLREKHIETSAQDQHRLDYENLLSNGYNDWALQLINEARYSEAKSFSKRSLEMKERLLGKSEDQFQFFISKILLAVVALSEGDYQQATSTAQESIEHVAREKGRDDPFTNHYMFYVANVWSAAGNHVKALELLKASLKARLRLFGEANYNTLNSHFAVALCLYRLKRYSQARAYIEWSLRKSKVSRWGREHVVRAQYVQSLIMQNIDGQDKAQWSCKGEQAIKDRNHLLTKYAKGQWIEPTSEVEDMVYFDYLVNFHAGRTCVRQLG